VDTKVEARAMLRFSEHSRRRKAAAPRDFAPPVPRRDTPPAGLLAVASGLPVAQAEELILAHEYFHCLECPKIGLTSKQYVVPTLKIGRLVLMTSGIRALSEIAAHGFARTFHERGAPA